MAKRTEALEVYFYKTSSSNEPVREWLKSLSKEDMKVTQRIKQSFFLNILQLFR